MPYAAVHLKQIQCFGALGFSPKTESITFRNLLSSSGIGDFGPAISSSKSSTNRFNRSQGFGDFGFIHNEWNSILNTKLIFRAKAPQCKLAVGIFQRRLAVLGPIRSAAVLGRSNLQTPRRFHFIAHPSQWRRCCESQPRAPWTVFGARPSSVAAMFKLQSACSLSPTRSGSRRCCESQPRAPFQELRNWRLVSAQ